MAQSVIRRPFTTEVRVRSQVSLCWISGAQSGMGTGFSPVLRFSSASIIAPVLHTQLHLTLLLSSKKQCCFGEKKDFHFLVYENNRCFETHTDGKVTRLWARQSGARFSTGARNHCLLQNVETVSLAPPNCWSVGTAAEA